LSKRIAKDRGGAGGHRRLAHAEPAQLTEQAAACAAAGERQYPTQQ
jgi:hypothetical protein